MKITKSQACQILGVPDGATLDEIRSSYKHLARKWHPDKQDGSIGSEEATRKFQEVSAAYKKLTSNEKDFDEDRMTLSEMMELYRQFFSYGNQMGQCNCPHHHHPMYRFNEEMSDYDDYDYTDDDDSDEEFWESIASRLRSKYEARKFMPKDSTDTPRSGITEEEALRNAQELIEEEEIEKRRKEKKKAKKKKKKEKKKQKEKEKDQPDDIQKNDINTEKANMNGPDLIAEEKKKNENSHMRIPNGYPSTLKNDAKNKPYTKNNKKHHEYTEQIQKPVQIVQEDIRPSLSKEMREEKGRIGKETKPSKNKNGSDEEEQFDASSAFFARAASKAPQTQTAPIQPPPAKDQIETKPTKKDTTKKNVKEKIKEVKKTVINMKEPKVEEPVEDLAEKEKDTPKIIPDGYSKEGNTNLNDVIIKSRKLAVTGNDFAANGEYLEAIKMFTEAILLDPTDFRFFGNRSYCYDRTGKFENALKDAESAIDLASQWPKGFFRKGRALMGLERYQEAEAAFQHVLTLDAECPDAQFELEKVRVRILTDMGFQPALAKDSVRIHGTVQAALEALLAGNVVRRNDGDGNESITEENYTKTNGVSPPEMKTTILVTSATQSKIKQRCTALWVGNVNSLSVTEKQLNQLFSKYGKLVSVRLLPEKYCAFINYQLPEDAGKALEKLQGFELGGQNLLIRYPNNPPPGSNVAVNTVKSNNTTPAAKKPVEKNTASKITGPVNGNECYFWRTTGCVFDVHCRYRHISENKGVDLSKVQAKYGTHL
ncbi:uncharacterized protein LOC135696066 isoform X1 [Rhopilema esculentum]|uniref:uncharacterized protein LOC135696066 isoform X1 n=1 Tax=Rhopilema esculentum TaxID=499914 RepID=UPI0031D1769A